MIEHLYGIDEEDYGKLKDSIALITVLIAGADGNIDDKEREWADKVAKIRGYSLPSGLRDFYKDVGVDFAEKVDRYTEEYGAMKVEKRNHIISEKLEKLNQVFQKIDDRDLAIEIYQSLLSFARHVAKASGGFLSWGSIGPKEKKLIDLPMLRPVES